MPLVKLDEVLRDADRGQYAVGAFNVVGIEFAEAILAAAERARSPVILAVAESHFPYVIPEDISPSLVAMASRSPAPVVLHLDHGQTLEAVMRALRGGFSSIMFDGSKLEYEENVRRTREIVTLCHAVGLPIEAELGAVGGSETGGVEGSANPALFTSPEQAGDFIARAGADALAVAIGNVHGKYRGAPCLDFPRLEAIRQSAGAPLVLHGGSGIPESDMQKAIALGIRKINVYTAMSQAALQSARLFLSKPEEAYHDYPFLLAGIKGSVGEVVEAHMRMFGSCGRF
jgi:fructose-bisphosphate aldolase class II